MTEFLRMTAQPLKLTLDNGASVSALLLWPDNARACFVLAHGAGAGMSHSFMQTVASGLAERGVATLRYQFPYMEKGSKRVDTPAAAHGAVRAAVEEAARLCPGLPLVAGGKSFGGRMTSQAQAIAALPGVRGLVFLGFPLHPPGKAATERAAHLEAVKVPMLFWQGTRDEFAELRLLQPVVTALGSRAALHLVTDGDHSLHVPPRSGRKSADVMAEVLDAVASWIGEQAGAG
jgi:uncharacterized protein